MDSNIVRLMPCRYTFKRGTAAPICEPASVHTKRKNDKVVLSVNHWTAAPTGRVLDAIRPFLVKLSPFHWFGESCKVSEQSVCYITAATPMTQHALEKTLGGDYRLRGGMETRGGDIVSVYQALSKGQGKLTVYGSSSGWVAEVTVADKAIESI